MLAAYLVIMGGGLAISGRLGLMAMGATFWATLAMGTGVLASQGQCITTRWSFAPVCGSHFWWIIITSPEVMVFFFFMITDPRTVPSGRVARVAFGALVGVVCTLLLAPWDTEFGTKVGLLGGLVLVCAFRPLIDRAFPAPHSPEDRLGPYLRRMVSGNRTTSAPGRVLVRAAAVLATLGVVGVGVAAAGLPNARTDRAVSAETTDVVPAIARVDPASLPLVTIDPVVAGLGAALATTEGAQELAATLMWNLEVENEAVATGNPGLLPTVDDGERLLDREAAIAAGDRTVSSYHFDSLHLEVVFPGGLQRGANAGLVAEGTVEEIELGPDGAEIGRVTKPLATTFSLRQTTSGRWLLTDTLPVPVR
jgi:hypothetical protein